jgi:hypothetical protein
MAAAWDSEAGVVTVKKVRYALGAVGLAPAMGMLMPAPTAAATAGHAPAGTAKTVSLQHLRGYRGYRADGVSSSPCLNRSIVRGNRSTHGLLLNIGHSFSCVHRVIGELSTGHTGLDMRTQVYSRKGLPLEFENYVKASIVNGITQFTTDPNVNGSYVCIALVQSTHHSKIVNNWGPDCVSHI